MKPRFQADADFNELIVKAVLLLEPHIDFRTAGAAKLKGIPDGIVLRTASDDGRLLLTHDGRTMPLHFGNFVEKHKSYGVIVFSQDSSISVVAKEILSIWFASEETDWIDRIYYYNRLL